MTHGTYVVKLWFLLVFGIFLVVSSLLSSIFFALTPCFWDSSSKFCILEVSHQSSLTLFSLMISIVCL